MKNIRLRINDFLQNVKKNNISQYAAQGAYYIILSFIPFVILLLTLIQYIGLDKENLFFFIQAIIPENMNETILGIIQEVYSKSLGTISISLIFIMWSAGKGFYSLSKGLQEIYEVKEKPTYVSLKIKSSIYTLGFIFLIILALVSVVFGQSLINFIQNKFNANINIDIFKTRDIIVAIGVLIFLILVYKYIPEKENKFKEQFPGAIIGMMGWILVSKIFSVYLNVFTGFSVMYGSLTTIVLIMMWVYFCMYMILVGAQINNFILKNKKA